jgi:hypothetical protein
MNLIEEHGGDLSPESRAAILGEVLRFITPKIEPVPYGTLLSHVMQYFDATEELVSLRVVETTLVLCAAGLLQSNTYHQEPKRGEHWLMVKVDTTISPSRQLTGFAYGRVD